jgi:hypothetical protein
MAGIEAARSSASSTADVILARCSFLAATSSRVPRIINDLRRAPDPLDFMKRLRESRYPLFRGAYPNTYDADFGAERETVRVCDAFWR